MEKINFFDKKQLAESFEIMESVFHVAQNMYKTWQLFENQLPTFNLEHANGIALRNGAYIFEELLKNYRKKISDFKDKNPFVEITKPDFPDSEELTLMMNDPKSRLNIVSATLFETPNCSVAGIEYLSFDAVTGEPKFGPEEKKKLKEMLEVIDCEENRELLNVTINYLKAFDEVKKYVKKHNLPEPIIRKTWLYTGHPWNNLFVEDRAEIRPNPRLFKKGGPK